MRTYTATLLAMIVCTICQTKVSADHHLANDDQVAGAEFIPGTWVRETITPEGNVWSMTKTIVAREKPNHYVEVVTVTVDGELTNKIEVRFSVEPVVGKVLKFVGQETRRMNLEDSTWSSWSENNFRYVFQPDEFFWNEIIQDLDNGNKRKFRRINTLDTQVSYKDLAQRKLEQLAGMIGTWEGEVKQTENVAYGFPAHTQQISHPIQFARDKTMIIWNWTSDLFQAYGAISYNASTRDIVINYHTSTGVQMSGKLIAAEDNRFLWEREGHTPTGVLREKCLIDLSKPDIFRHVIFDRTLNGIPGTEDPEIILKKVK